MSTLRAAAVFALAVFTAPLVGCDGGDDPGDSPMEDPGSGSNQAPMASISASPEGSEVEVGTEVEVDGSGSTDPDGDELTYSWSLTTPSGSEAQLSDKSDVSPTFTPDVEGDYTPILTVDDGSAESDESTDLAAVVPAVTINEDIQGDRTLTADSTYRIQTSADGDPIEVFGDATLTVEPGTEILFEEDAGLKVLTSSEIRANGTGNEPITMTGTGESAQAGGWIGISIQGGRHELNHVTIRHTGSQAFLNAEKAALTVNESSEEANPTVVEVTNSTFSAGDGRGFALNGITDSYTVTVEALSNNEFRQMGGAEVYLHTREMGVLDGSNEFGEGSIVEVNGIPARGLNRPATLTNLGENAHYRFSGSPQVRSGRLEIEPGTEMRFVEGGALEIDGGRTGSEVKLVAEGTAEDPITMAATEGNGAPGWWTGVILAANYDATIRNTTVRHGGLSGQRADGANIEVGSKSSFSPSNAVLEENAIEESSGNGVQCTGSDASVQVSGNSFSGISEADISNCGL